MKNKKILLIGGKGGLGSALLEELSKNNKVIVAGKSCNENNNFEGQITYHYLNLLDTDTILNFFEKLESNNIKVDVVIFNSSINEFNNLENQSIESVHKIIKINLEGCILINKLSLNILKENGRICNISSVLGSVPLPFYSVYSSTKAAIKAFSQSLNRELIDTNKKILYYQPRAINTEMNSEQMNEFNKIMGSNSDEVKKVSKQIIKFINKDKNGIFNFQEKFFSFINLAFPTLIDNNIKKLMPKFKKLFEGK
tara:strand:- start:27459 stop:28220 length:762 start_codon:yes stop_codon:yes gene_type:complete